VTEPNSHVEQQIQARIAAARFKVQAAKQRRDELAAARRRGLAARHAAKLAHLDQKDTVTPIGRQRGAAAIGARQPGDVGPFGHWPDPDEDDGQEHDDLEDAQLLDDGQQQ
jgi:hypothetical protein